MDDTVGTSPYGQHQFAERDFFGKRDLRIDGRRLILVLKIVEDTRVKPCPFRSGYARKGQGREASRPVDMLCESTHRYLETVLIV
jgi:hypothetical protein